MPQGPTAKPRARRVRLPSLKSTPIPSARNTPAPESAPSEATPRKNVRSCPGCSTPDLQENDGQLVCMNCGTVVSDSVIVNEITFGEASSGAPLVQGTTVHDGQRFAKSTSGGFRRGGRTSEETNEKAMREGKDVLTRLAIHLNIGGMVDKAFNLYQMARIHQFQRPIHENAAICLYVACRQTKGNTVMLIDLAEQIGMNVFDLGATYKKFIKAISLEEDLEYIPIIEIEPLLMKFAKNLEFGGAIKQVANDAASILARMDRDWMVTGRQPMGLCGACLILAARMNNFRRSVREVVFVVKASDITIIKRLNEFQRTDAGRLTVQDFRQFSHRLKTTHDPPSLTNSIAKKRRLLELHDDEPGAESSSTRHSSANPRPSQELRRDADGFAIPSLPTELSQLHLPTPSPSVRTASASLERESREGVEDHEPAAPKRKRPGRPKKVKLPPVVVREQDLIVEGELEEEITQIVQQHDGDERFEVTHARALALAEVEKAKARRSGKWAISTLPDTQIIGTDEFEDDPEVANCLLDKKEVEVKEKIWVTHNADWLRAEQERKLNQQMEEAKGNKKKTGPRKKMIRRGDGSVLGNTPVSSPAEASQRMLAKRANRTAFSKHLDYDKLKAIYADDNESTSGSSPAPSSMSDRSRSSSVHRSVSVSSAPGGRKPHNTTPSPKKPEQATVGATKEQPLEIQEDAEVSDAETIEIDDDGPTAVTAFEDDDDEEIEEEVFDGEEAYDAELAEAQAFGVDMGEYDE